MEAGIAISCEMQGLVGVQLRMVLKHNAEKTVHMPTTSNMLH
jgi:hypothetical protein